MKKILMVVVTMLLMLMLSACGKGEVSIDVSKLGERLSGEIAYTDSLGMISVDKAGMFINLADIEIVDGVIYEGAGATAEEIVVLECVSEAEATKVKDRLLDRVNEQKESFEDYVPSELSKLDSAVIEIAGKYAIMCVSDDSDMAREIIKDAVNGQ